MRFSQKPGFTMLGMLLGFSALAGCKGPVGATGPLGPAGSGTASPVYLFSQNFDGSGYNPTTQFTVYQNAGAEVMGLTGSDFNTAPDSLSVTASTGGVGAGSGVYTFTNVVPYVSGEDYYFDAYVNLNTTAPAKTELVLNVNGSTVADLGFLAPSTVYTYNNGSQVNLSTSISSSYFHHAVLYWNHATGLSSLTLDGNQIAANIVGTRTRPTGAPSTSVGLYFPVSTNPGDYVLLDTLNVYHY